MLHTASVELLSDETATGEWKFWPGGRGFFCVVATDLDGESVTLQMLGPDGSTPIDASDVGGNAATLSANGGLLFELPPCQVRAAVSTGGGTTVAIYARADRIPG